MVLRDQSEFSELKAETNLNYSGAKSPEKEDSNAILVDEQDYLQTKFECAPSSKKYSTE